MKRLLLLALLLIALAAGCGDSSKSAGDASKKITWEQYQKMPPEDQADPYVLNNLDDDVRKKLAEQAKKMKR